MKIKLLVLFIAFTLQSCMFGLGDITANEEINNTLKQTIRAKNDSLLAAMSNSDLKVYKALGSEEFIKHIHAETRNFVWLYRKGYLDNQYTIFNEYHSSQSKPFKQVKIASEKDGYTLAYLSEEKETYVSLLKTSLYQNDYLLIVIYGLTDKGWKINDVEVSMFGHYGKTAKDYYDAAKKCEEEGFLIDAFHNVDMALVSIDQAESMLKFDDYKSMKLYHEKLKREIKDKYKFPYVIEDISTQPEILDIEYVTTKDGMFPLINYKTLIPIKDSIKLRDEYMLIKEKAKDIYKDLDFNKKMVYYRAAEKLPDPNGGTYNEYYNFTDIKNK